MRFLLLAKFFFLFFAFSTIFSETLYLKEKIILNQNKTQIKNLFSNSTALIGEIYLTSRFYSSSELIEMLSKKRIDDVILMGRGINVRIVSPISDKNLKHIIENSIEGHEITDVNVNSSLPVSIYVENISNSIQNNIAEIFIEGYYFTNEIGVETNFSLKFNVRKKEEKRIFLKNIGEKDADLCYSNKNMQIRIKVKIVKRLPDGFYLVQNENKIMKVRAENER
ncbi:MAG: hypothetical protein ACP5QT_05050 [Brevinematia bacterium]